MSRSLRASQSVLNLSTPASEISLVSSPPSLSSLEHYLTKSASTSKFGTINLNSNGRPQIMPRAFTDGSLRNSENHPPNELEGLRMGDDVWNISIADHYHKKRSFMPRKKIDLNASLTLYVATSSSSSTLLRTREEIIDLDYRLRSDIHGVQPFVASLHTPPSTPPRKRNVLAAISSTLSPRRSSASSTSPSSPVSPSKASSHLSSFEVTELSAYLTNLSRQSKVREHKAWKSFFAAKRLEDLESIRVERRISRTMSTKVVGRGSNSLKSRRANDIMADLDEEEDSFIDDRFPVGVDEDEDEDETLQAISSTRKRLISESMGDAPAIEQKKKKNELGIESFEILRVLGKGCAGKVLLVRQKITGEIYAMKTIQKNHVLAHRELEHTRTEQGVLKRCSRDSSNPFVVKLFYSFHDRNTLYLALEFHNGGDLATQLARWGRLGRDRARFYTAEIVEGVAGLHAAGVIYRDLKPENVLISSEGHVVLTDFGLSKDFHHATTSKATLAQSVGSLSPMSLARETTMTFCGTAEYLAPEVLLGLPYSYEVDAWSLGNMLYEMLAGVTPFWAENHADMYKQVLHGVLSFDNLEIFDADTKNLLRGLLQRDPLLRMTDDRIKRHPYFSSISWDHVHHRRYVAPFIPEVDPLDETDTRNFDDAFLGMKATVAGYEGDNDDNGGDRDSIVVEEGDRELSEGEPEERFDEDGNDVFDGYSFFGKATDDEEDSIMEDDEALHSDEEEGDSSSRMNSESTLAHTIVEESIILYQTPHLHYHDDSFSPPSPLTMILGNRSRIFEHLDTQRQEEEEDDDNDWDVVDVEGEAKNGDRATLFAMGVRDRYRLLVTPSFLSPSTTRLNNSLSPSSSTQLTKSASTSSRHSSDTSMNITPSTSSKRAPLARLLSRNSSSSTSTTTTRKKNKLVKSSTSTTGSRGDHAPRGLEMSPYIAGKEEERDKSSSNPVKRTLAAFKSKK